jgi:MFS family permease
VRTIAPAAEPRAPKRRSNVAAAFRYRDFRLLWSGLLIGNLGTWMQFTTLGYLVAYLAPTPALASLYVGFLGASRAVPVLICSPIAGVVADRFPRRRVLLVTNSMTSVFSLLLAVLSTLHGINIYGLLAISACLAATLSFDSPARQSWIPILVPREHISNAIGLNQVGFNLPAVIGPPIAGILIAATGVAVSFYINAAAQIAVVIALVMMRPAPPGGAGREPMLAAMGSGIRFLIGHPVLRWVVLILMVNALLLRPYNFLLPAYALHVVQTDARGLGWLMAAAGAGGICGAVFTAVVNTERRGLSYTIASTVMALATLGLGLVASMPVALGALFGLGVGNLAFTGAANYLLQTLAPNEVRGRAVSVYSMILLGLVPFGALVLGTCASISNLSIALLGAGAIALAVSAWVWLAHPAMREA